ncbi:berberine and berberine like family protein, partial [Vibrio parahaemolyticus V-223/04]
MSDSIFC